MHADAWSKTARVTLHRVQQETTQHAYPCATRRAYDMYAACASKRHNTTMCAVRSSKQHNAGMRVKSALSNTKQHNAHMCTVCSEPSANEAVHVCCTECMNVYRQPFAPIGGEPQGHCYAIPSRFQDPGLQDPATGHLGKASRHTGFTQRDRAARWPAFVVGNGHKLPPVWKLAFQG